MAHSVSFFIILIITVLVFPMNLYNLYSAKKAQKLLTEYASSSLEGMASLYVSGLEAQMQGINRYIMSIEENNTSLAKMCHAVDWDTYYMAAFSFRRNLEDQMALSDEADVYFFYVPEMEHGMLVEDSPELSQTELQQLLFSDEGLLKSRKWKIVQIEGTKWLLHVNTWKNVYLGAGIQLDPMEQMVPENLPGESIIASFTTENDIQKQKGYLFVTKQCLKQDIYLTLQISELDIVRNLPILQRYAMVIVGLEFLIIPLILYLIRLLILQPLNKINGALNELKTNPDVRIRGKAFSMDFDNVYQSFNGMADEIVELKIHNYEQQLEKQRIEMRNLQLQIKPHFLFNSLNLMFNLIQMGEHKSVQKMLLYFSDYFRYINVGENDFSRFADEYDLILKYLDVSRIRYPDIVEYECEISEETFNIWIPQLLIHNFVENVIKHGLDLKRKNHILLKAYCTGTEAVFVILDDGVGMSVEQAENINQGNFSYADGKRHLGLKNSYRRIQFYYRGDGNFHISSQPGKGTTATIKIPIKK